MIREKCCLSQMSKNGDVERAFHVEGTAYAEEQMQKREKQSQGQVFLLRETTSRQLPRCAPFQPEYTLPVFFKWKFWSPHCL